MFYLKQIWCGDIDLIISVSENVEHLSFFILVLSWYNKGIFTATSRISHYQDVTLDWLSGGDVQSVPNLGLKGLIAILLIVLLTPGLQCEIGTSPYPAAIYMKYFHTVMNIKYLDIITIFNKKIIIKYRYIF